MNTIFDRPPTQYLRRRDVTKRYDFSTEQFYRLRHHPDPLQRFPRPTMILLGQPLWSLSDLEAYDNARRVKAS